MPHRPVSALLSVVLIVSVIVEFFRYLIHSTEFQAHPHLWLISIASIGLNLAYHRWILPETLPQTVVSAVLSEAGLPVVAHVLWQSAMLISKGIIVSPKPPPH